MQWYLVLLIIFGFLMVFAVILFALRTKYKRLDNELQIDVDEPSYQSPIDVDKAMTQLINEQRDQLTHSTYHVENVSPLDDLSYHGHSTDTPESLFDESSSHYNPGQYVPPTGKLTPITVMSQTGHKTLYVHLQQLVDDLKSEFGTAKDEYFQNERKIVVLPILNGGLTFHIGHGEFEDGGYEKDELVIFEGHDKWLRYEDVPPVPIWIHAHKVKDALQFGS